MERMTMQVAISSSISGVGSCKTFVIADNRQETEETVMMNCHWVGDSNYPFFDGKQCQSPFVFC